MFNKLYSKVKEYSIDIIFFSIIIILILLFKIELPYTIYMPGGTDNVSKSIKIVNENVNTGTYKSLYVSTIKTNPITYLIAKINSKWDLVENKEMSLTDKEKYDDIFERDKLFLKYSKTLAIKTAYKKANKTFNVLKNNIYVIGSETDIKIGEQILKINDIEVNSLEEIKSILKGTTIDDNIIVETKYKDKIYRKNIKLKQKDNSLVLGLYLMNIEDYIVEPNIEIKSDEKEAGASSGLMLTLSIYDKLIDEDLSKGLVIAGTGTIEEDGSVGKIDGLKHKMLGLNKEKYDVFFIPYDNLDEANEINEKYGLNMKYIPVKTFDEAVQYLENVKK